MQPGNETTVEEWEKRFQIDVKRRPGWSVLPIEMLFSQAYRSLTGSAQLALLFALSQVSWEKTRRPGKRKNLRNDTIYLPTNALIALGIKSGSTRTALRKEMVEKGFLDVKKTGSYLNCGVFKASGRWRYYPNGDYKPQDQPPAGISMGHRFKGKLADEDAPEVVFPRSEIERKEDSEIERKGYPEKTPEDDLLRLKIERKGLRSEIERTVLCTIAKQSVDMEGVDVQVQENNPGEEETKDPSKEIVPPASILDTPSITEAVPSESIQDSLKHEWFLDTFKEACNHKGIDPQPRIDPSLASALDDWLDQRLSKKSYLGNKVFYDETIPRIKEKINEIVSQWEFIKISYLGERVQIPDVPDLEFLVTYREQIFAWVSEQRQRSLNSIFAQFETKEQAAPAHAH
jgi:hypothetical protein